MGTVTVAFQTDKSLSVYGHLARLVEGYGFSGVSLYNDLFYQPAWPGLLEIAKATERVKIGPAAVNPFTTHPAVIAGEIALLDEASNGRAYLGMARGAWLDHLGIQLQRPVKALQEAFALVRHLLRGRKEPFTGETFQTAAGDGLKWHVLRPELPFMLGSWGERTIRACFEHIQEFKLGGTANPDLIPHYVRSLEAMTPPGDHPRELVVGAVTVVDKDGGAARAFAKQKVGLYLPVVANLDPTIQVEAELLERIEAIGQADAAERVVDLISDELLERFAFAGTAVEVSEQAIRLFDAGVNRIEFGTPHGLKERSGLEHLGRQVLPALRASGVVEA
jgi:5,10-methylenetetrahydromethanopterin reductase